jgi:hypothetical protein
LYQGIEFGINYVREVEYDPLTPIASGTLTGIIYRSRFGFTSGLLGAVIGTALSFGIEYYDQPKFYPMLQKRIKALKRKYLKE